eukprot:1219423-Amphidinium_carterae.1
MLQGTPAGFQEHAVPRSHASLPHHPRNHAMGIRELHPGAGVWANTPLLVCQQASKICKARLACSCADDRSP